MTGNLQPCRMLEHDPEKCEAVFRKIMPKQRTKARGIAGTPTASSGISVVVLPSKIGNNGSLEAFSTFRARS